MQEEAKVRYGVVIDQALIAIRGSGITLEAKSGAKYKLFANAVNKVYLTPTQAKELSEVRGVLQVGPFLEVTEAFQRQAREKEMAQARRTIERDGTFADADDEE